MTKLIKTFLTDTSGAAAAEYALILAVVGAGIAVSAGLLGQAINDVIVDTTADINGPAPAP